MRALLLMGITPLTPEHERVLLSHATRVKAANEGFLPIGAIPINAANEVIINRCHPYEC